MLFVSGCELFAFVSEISRLGAEAELCRLADWKMWWVKVLKMGGEVRPGILVPNIATVLSSLSFNARSPLRFLNWMYSYFL